jgi:tRNA pseudouridine55 synthase
MRTLAHDLGQVIGCGGYLSWLNRERVGKFSLTEATPLDKVDLQHLIPLREALPPVPVVPLNGEQAADVREGRAVTVSKSYGGPLAGLLGPEGSVIGMARVFGNLLQPECVIPIEVIHDSV